jgi:hypothetical protein
MPYRNPFTFNHCRLVDAKISDVFVKITGSWINGYLASVPMKLKKRCQNASIR